jgi:hypothetical protein
MRACSKKRILLIIISLIILARGNKLSKGN